jgi:hypothetical protein
MPSIKPYFPILLIGSFILYVGVIAPWIVDFFIDDAIELFVSNFAVAMVQIMLFIMFIMFLTFPISLAIRDIKVGHMELVMKAPISSSDMLLGEFLGKLPFYSIFAVVIGGLFTAILAPLSLDYLQLIIIIMIFAVNFLSAYWIGIVIGTLVRAKLMKSSRGRDLGKALTFVVVFPVIVVLYAVLGTISNESKSLESFQNDILMIFPSSWGSEVIVDFVRNPGTITDLSFDTYLQLGSLILFFLCSLWVGVIVVKRAFHLEPTSFSATSVNPHGKFYQIIRRIGGGGSFGVLLASNFKNYVRRFENLSKLFYSIGLIVVMAIFMVDVEGDSKIIYMVSQIFGVLLAGFIVGELTMQGKENMLLYRQTPITESRFIFAKLLMYILIVVPIVLFFQIFLNSLVPGATIISIIRTTVFVTLLSVGLLLLSMGLFMLNPAYSDRAPEFMLNLQILIMFPLFSLFGSLIIFRRPFPEIQIIHVSLVWIVGLVVFLLGKRNLARIE